MRVSVALATYNGARWVGEQLTSLVEQERPPDEVIVADDGSEDGTLEVVAGFGDRLPLQFVEGPRVGATRNFARAFAATTGDLVLPCDQDDWWYPRKVWRLAEIAAASDADLFVHDLVVCDEDLLPRGRLLRQYALRGIAVSNHIKGCCMAVRRSLLDRVVFEDNESHDGQIAASAGRRVLVKEPLIRYRVHGANASAWGVTLDRIGPMEMSRGLYRRARRLVG